MTNTTVGSNRVGEAKISDYSCPYCFDSGIITGTAEYDGEKIVVMKICYKCDARNKNVKVENNVQYDF